FYKRAFNATELMRIPAPNQRIGHAEIKIGDSVIMLADEHPDIQARGPQHYGGSPVSILLYVDNVDAVFRQAVSAGGKETRPGADPFYRDRSGRLPEPLGQHSHLPPHK